MTNMNLRSAAEAVAIAGPFLNNEIENIETALDLIGVVMKAIDARDVETSVSQVEYLVHRIFEHLDRLHTLRDNLQQIMPTEEKTKAA